MLVKRRVFYQFYIFIISDYCFVKINGFIYNRLFLFFVQDFCKFQVIKQLLAIKNKGQIIGIIWYNVYTDKLYRFGIMD